MTIDRVSDLQAVLRYGDQGTPRSLGRRFLLHFDDMRVLIIEGYEPVRKSVATGLREAGFAIDAVQDGLWYAESNATLSHGWMDGRRLCRLGNGGLLYGMSLWPAP